MNRSKKDIEEIKTGLDAVKKDTADIAVVKKDIAEVKILREEIN